MEAHAQDERHRVIAAAGEAIAAMAERVGPAVVGLGRGWGLGSGVVVAPGRVLTSAHAVRGDETAVTFDGGRTATGHVEGADPDRDVAVLSVDTGDIGPVAWEPPHAGQVGVGAPVIALANPGGRGLRATLGFVSAAGRRFRGLRGRRLRIGIEHTAPLPRGSSGGPLVDTKGRLLGLNTLRLEGGLVLAVAADRPLRERFEALARGVATPPRRLGVALAPAGVARRMRGAVGLPERDGLLVRAVEEGSPAGAAGVSAGDLVVAAGGHDVAGVDDLHTALDAVSDDGELDLRVVRGADELAVRVVFPSEGGGRS